MVLPTLIRRIHEFSSSLALYARLLPYVRAERRLLAVAVAAMLGSTVLTLCQPWPLQVIVDSVLGGHPAPPWITVVVGELSPMALLTTAIAAMISVLVLRQVTILAQGYFSQVLGQHMVFTFRCDLYAKLQRLALKFHDHNTVGDLMYRVTEDAPALQDLVIYGFVPLAIQFVTAVAILSTIFWLDVRLGMTAVLIVPVLILSTIWFSEQLRQLSRTLANAESSLCARVSENLGSIRAVKSFGMEDRELESFRNRARLSQEAYVRVVALSSAGGSVTEAIAGIGTAVVVFLGAVAVLGGDFTVGQLLVFVAYVQSLYDPITQLAGSALVIQRSSASIERAMEIFDEEDEHAKSGNLKPAALRGQVAFQNVRFGYDGNRDAIRDVTFDILPGETVAFVGPSGAGKTTLISLLLRFYEAGSGRILLDGTDTGALDLHWLRRQTALVLQEPIIFSCSLRENIAYGRPDASHSEIEQAAKAAGLHDFIVGLPEGYASCVGERGVRLSGGQRQRLSIARAFLKDAPVLILDEPTSNLDATIEQHIFEALERLVQGRTTLYIAHRLATARRADRIIVLDEGRIVEQGTHGALLAAGGLYARLHGDQHHPEATLPGSAAHLYGRLTRSNA